MNFKKLVYSLHSITTSCPLLNEMDFEEWHLLGCYVVWLL
jgi:hypothetical protein